MYNPGPGDGTLERKVCILSFTKRPTLFEVSLITTLLLIAMLGEAQAGSGATARGPKFSTPVAFDVSLPARDLAGRVPLQVRRFGLPVRGPVDADRRLDQNNGPVRTGLEGFAGDAALQTSASQGALIPAPLNTFERLSNQDNFNLFGFRVWPPDPNGQVGPTSVAPTVSQMYGLRGMEDGSLSRVRKHSSPRIDDMAFRTGRSELWL